MSKLRNKCNSDLLSDLHPLKTHPHPQPYPLHCHLYHSFVSENQTKYRMHFKGAKYQGHCADKNRCLYKGHSYAYLANKGRLDLGLHCDEACKGLRLTACKSHNDF